MNQGNQDTFKMWKGVLLYLDNNAVVWNGNKSFSTIVAAIRDTISNVHAALQGQTGTSTGLSEDKSYLEAAAVNLVAKMAKGVKAYARIHKDNELKAKVNFRKSTLLGLPEVEKIERLRSIVKAIEVKQADLSDFGIKSDTVLNTNAAINDYEAASNKPRAAITGKATVTATIPTLMKEGRDNLEILDDMVHIFDENDPGFSSGYKAARVKVTAGTRHKTPDITG